MHERKRMHWFNQSNRKQLLCNLINLKMHLFERNESESDSYCECVSGNYAQCRNNDELGGQAS